MSRPPERFAAGPLSARGRFVALLLAVLAVAFLGAAGRVDGIGLVISRDGVDRDAGRLTWDK